MKSHHLMCITEFERAFICLCCLPFINLNKSLKIVCSFECLILMKKSIKQILYHGNIEHSFECVASVFLEITSVFSSPELKAQVSFSDNLPSVRPSVCLSVCLSVCKLFTFSPSSPEPLSQFQPNLPQSILG